MTLIDSQAIKREKSAERRETQEEKQTERFQASVQRTLICSYGILTLRMFFALGLPLISFACPHFTHVNHCSVLSTTRIGVARDPRADALLNPPLMQRHHAAVIVYYAKQSQRTEISYSKGGRASQE